MNYDNQQKVENPPFKGGAGGQSDGRGMFYQVPEWKKALPYIKLKQSLKDVQ